MLDVERINEYLDSINTQLEDIENLPVPDLDFLKNEANFERRKAIERSLELAIEDVIHISSHICAGLGLERVTDDAADTLLALGRFNIIPIEFAERIRGMVGFRNRLVHEYVPSKFDVVRIYENLQSVNDFQIFARHIVEFLERQA